MAKTRRARIDAENDHRRVTRPRLRIIVKETRGYLTGCLRAQSATIEYDRGSREVGYGFSIILGGLWLSPVSRHASGCEIEPSVGITSEMTQPLA